MKLTPRHIRQLLFLNILFMGNSLMAIDPFVVSHKNSLVDKIDISSYVWIEKNGSLEKLQNVSHTLPINASYLCFLILENKNNTGVERVLQFGHHYVVPRQVYLTTISGLSKTRTIEGSDHLQLNLAANEKLLVGFWLEELDRAEPLLFKMNLYTTEAFEKDLENVYSTQSFFLGLFGFLVLFNIILFLVTRWRVYLKYAFYIFSALLYFSYYFGILQSFFPSLNQVSVNIAYTWYSLIFISYFFFLNEFGDYKRYVPRAHKLLNIGIIFKTGEGILNTFLHLLGFSFIYSKLYINIILVFEIILMGFILYYILKNKHIRGRLVVIASLFLIAMGILEQSKIFPQLDNAFFVELGIVCELMTFSVGLGYITRLHYNEKHKAELLYLEQLLANEKLRSEQTEKLEALVNQRTEELKYQKEQVEQKNNENELLLSEVHHRVKNNLQVVSSLLNLQEKSIKNQEAKIAIRQGRERIRSLELVHKLLYRKHSYGSIEMKDYISQLASGLSDSFGAGYENTRINIAFPKLLVDIDTAIPLGLILNELLVNALKHARQTDKTLEIEIDLRTTEGKLMLRVSDNGVGSSSEIEKSDSFGLRIIRALVRQLEGELTISDTLGLSYVILFKPVNQKIKEHESIDSGR